MRLPYWSTQLQTRSTNRSLTDVVPRYAVGGQHSLDYDLGGYPGVVAPGEEERRLAPHAVPSHHQVFECRRERMPHVQLARDVGRRHDDDERLLRRIDGTGVK